uniref:Uncharacterized protein n=1 Tax=Chromera velia CCMP2878 TaxID=1169474 RepID=A0A0G4GNN1_9ALVE|eukprot:Cvel_4969.t1-p1 / transcript=Cvel_4969.t1 / gene=Cvel_4969 / organism=Chromera_velia_CCMP2878 / gene_product=hypothetical protein / transcript_product=hypothetical protein / location=Cvel_scaffold224:119930-121053(+) / protein_length=318 / sequence_SO=supercontig / SO=protein_coding / is_pseudo=false
MRAVLRKYSRYTHRGGGVAIGVDRGGATRIHSQARSKVEAGGVYQWSLPSAVVDTTLLETEEEGEGYYKEQEYEEPAYSDQELAHFLAVTTQRIQELDISPDAYLEQYGDQSQSESLHVFVANPPVQQMDFSFRFSASLLASAQTALSVSHSASLPSVLRLLHDTGCTFTLIPEFILRHPCIRVLWRRPLYSKYASAEGGAGMGIECSERVAIEVRDLPIWGGGAQPTVIIGNVTRHQGVEFIILASLYVDAFFEGRALVLCGLSQTEQLFIALDPKGPPSGSTPRQCRWTSFTTIKPGRTHQTSGKGTWGTAPLPVS